MSLFKPFHQIRRIAGSVQRLNNGVGCLLLWAFIGFNSSGALAATVPEASPDPYALETPEQRDARMAWWREARFGMFIHWGVYAVPAGTFNGKKIPGIGEWIMQKGKIPVGDYKAYAQQFNPVQYDPKAWARLAKQAGMRYVVITSKHHDGFALFPTDVTEWDVVDATPYGKDLIGPLAEAVREEGMKFGLYYSQAQDWVHPGGGKAAHKEGEGWDEAHRGDFDAYLKSIAVPQVEEILRLYRPDVLWWDTPQWMNTERAKPLLAQLKQAPGIIHNNRLGGNYRGDTETPEQRIPATGFKDRDWEVCMTMNDTWGFKSYDDNWKAAKDLLQKLCDIASKGGNFLLNVGPTAEGLIPQPSIERLEHIGAWMDTNGQAIYGTTASPFHRLSWGRCTRKQTADGVTLYLHVFDWPTNGKLLVPGLMNQPRSIQLLSGGQSLESQQAKGDEPGLLIEVPEKAPDPCVSVIKLEISETLQVVPNIPEQSAEGSLVLTPHFADLHNTGIGIRLTLGTHEDKEQIEGWTDSKDYVEWVFQISKPGRFKIMADVALEKSIQLTCSVEGQSKAEVSLEGTGGLETFQSRELGTLAIKTAGTHTLKLSAVKKNWAAVNLRGVTLIPEK